MELGQKREVGPPDGVVGMDDGIRPDLTASRPGDVYLNKGRDLPRRLHTPFPGGDALFLGLQPAPSYC